MGHSNIIRHCIVLQVLHFVLNEVAIEWVTQSLRYIALFFVLHFVLNEVAIESVTQTLRYIVLFFKCYILFLMRLPLNGSLKHYATLPLFFVLHFVLNEVAIESVTQTLATLYCSSSATFCS